MPEQSRTTPPDFQGGEVGKLFPDYEMYGLVISGLQKPLEEAILR